MASSVVVAAPQLVIADTADGAFIPTSAFTYMRYRQRCAVLWRVDQPAPFERYERFLGKIGDLFGVAEKEATLEHSASDLIKGTCMDFVGLEELDNETR